jgi:hypothetical protein
MFSVACCKSTVVVRCNGASFNGCSGAHSPWRRAAPLHFVALRPIERGEVRY